MINTQNNNHIDILETETETAANRSLEPKASDSCSLSLRERAGVRGNSASNFTEDSPTNETCQPEFPILACLPFGSLPARPRNEKIAALPTEIRDHVN